MTRRAGLSTRTAYYLVTSLNWFATVMPMAVMVLLAQSRGLGLTEVGLFMGVYSLVVVALEVPSGALSDTIGRKRTFLLGGVLSLLARVVFLLAFDLWAFVAFAVVLGASRALTSGALEAWFVDALQAEDESVDLQPALAAAGSFQLVGLALGTLAGGALPTLFAHLPTTGVLTPLGAPVLASIFVQAAVLAAAALVVREGKRAVAADDEAGAGAGALAVVGLMRRAFRTVVEVPRLRVLLTVDVVIGAALAASENLWQPFFAALLPGDGAAELAAGGGTVFLGVLLGGSFAVGIAGNVLATRLAKALGKRQALVAAIFQVLQGVAFVLLALSGRLLLAAGLFWATYLMRSGWSSPHLALFNREITSDKRSVMLSVQSLAFFCGSFIGSVALGWVAESFSISGAWMVAGIAVGLSSLLYLRLDAADRRAYRGTRLSVVEPK